jgi:hypothetical protein
MSIAQDLQDAVQRLATSVETPVVPGELPNWITAVGEVIEPLHGLLRNKTAQVDAAEYAQIIQEDPALAPQVEQLKQGDRECQRQLDALRERVEELKGKAIRREPDEASLNDQIKELVDQGLALVILIQTQEVARRTWLQEAFNRDRGVAD